MITPTVHTHTQSTIQNRSSYLPSQVTFPTPKLFVQQFDCKIMPICSPSGQSNYTIVPKQSEVRPLIFYFYLVFFFTINNQLLLFARSVTGNYRGANQSYGECRTPRHVKTLPGLPIWPHFVTRTHLDWSGQSERLLRRLELEASRAKPVPKSLGQPSRQKPHLGIINSCDDICIGVGPSHQLQEVVELRQSFHLGLT